MTMVARASRLDAAAQPISPIQRSEPTMITTTVQPQPGQHRGRSAAVSIAIGLIGSVAVAVLIVAGLTFFGLAIAFPIAVPVAAAYHLPVSAADAALAERLASVWWVFAALAIASFTGASVLVIKMIGFLSPTPRD
jgi:hypothetical protein